MRSNVSLSTSFAVRVFFALILFLAFCKPTHGLDLNNATKAQLRSIKGIGDKTAERILSARQQRPFLSLDDFGKRIPGFGPKRVEKLRQQGVTAGSDISALSLSATRQPVSGRHRDVTAPKNSSVDSIDLGSGASATGTSTARTSGRRHSALQSARYSGAEGRVAPAMPMLIRPRPRSETGDRSNAEANSADKTHSAIKMQDSIPAQ